MTFEPDDEATVLRQLREEIAKIREEQFVASLPTNNVGIASPVNSSSGVPLPTTGVDSTLPLVIFTTKDTGVIDLLNFDGKNPNKDFTIGETITGQSSGATAEVGDIDTLTSTTGVLTLVPSSITGTFNDNENLNGSGAGGNNIANADGSQFTQTGRGHLNAGAGSIIASSENVSAPFEIHFIDNAEQDGQIIYLRALEGQTIRMRRSVSFDGTTGNLDLDESFDIVENAIVFFQYQIASNISVTGGWVPLITSVSAVAGGGATFQFPILYPKEDLGTQNGVIDLSLTQSNGHYKQITLDGDASLTFSNLPPATNGFKFYVLTIQDGTGGHVYTDLPDSVLFESTLLGELQTAPNSQTLWQFSTADGGINWHATVINPQGGGAGDNLGNHIATKNLNMSTFDIFNIDKLLFASAGGFNFPVDRTLKGFSTSGTGIEANVPAFSEYRWFIDGIQKIAFEDTRAVFFTDVLPNENTKFSLGSIAFKWNEMFSHELFLQDLLIMAVGAKVDGDLTPNSLGKFLGGSASAEQWEAGFIRKIDLSPSSPLDLNFTGIHKVLSDLVLVSATNDISFFADGEIRLKMDQSANEWKFQQQNVGDINLLSTDNAIINQALAINESGLDPEADGVFRVRDIAGSRDVQVGTGGKIVNLSKLTSFIGFTADDDLDMGTFNIFNLDVLRFVVDGGVIGFNTYGISADSGNFSMNFSVPEGKGYSFQDNLDGIAFLDEQGLQLLSNTGQPDPRFIAREYTATTHTLGTTGLLDGSWRLVGGDVIFGSGGGLVNLTTLSVGGGDNLGNHLATQALDMDGNPVLDALSYSFINGATLSNATNGSVIIGVPSGTLPVLDIDIAGTTEYRFGGGTFNLKPEGGLPNRRIVNVQNPFSPQDVATKDYVDGVAGGSGLLSSTNTWTGINTFTGSSHSITSSNIFLGDTTSDNIFILARIGTSLIPDIDNQFDLGIPGLEWRNLNIDGTANIDSLVMGGNINMNFNRIFNVPTVPALANDATSKAYVDSVSGGGLLASNNTWTGTNSFFADVSFGNSTSDRVNFFARVATDIVPRVNNSEDLGISSNRWRDLFIDGSIRIRTGSIVLEDASSQISMSGGPISGVGLFANTGSFFHGGSTLGFFGKTPLSTKLTALLANFTTAGNANAINTLIGILQNYGLVN